MSSWHEPTKEEIEGNGDFRYLIDIMPDQVPHQASRDGDALIRVSKHGWSWGILDVGQSPPKYIGEVGYADDRWIAIAQAKDALAKLRS